MEIEEGVVRDFDELVEQAVEPFVQHFELMHEDLRPLANLITNCFRHLRFIVASASKQAKPSQEELGRLVGPMAGAVEEVVGSRDKHSPVYSHMSALSFMLPALLFPLVLEQTPVALVDESISSSSKYIEKVSSGKLHVSDPTPAEAHVKWAQLASTLMIKLKAYVLKYHSKEMYWGESPVATEEKKQETGTSLYQKGKWVVENHGKTTVDLPADRIQSKQNVFITKCDGTTIRIGSKVKAVLIEKCTKCHIEVDSVVSSVELINCSHVKLSMSKDTPTVSLERSHDCQVFLSETCLDCNPQIFSSNIANVSLELPHPDPKRGFAEIPLPTQFVSKISKGTSPGSYNVSTTAVQHT